MNIKKTHSLDKYKRIDEFTIRLNLSELMMVMHCFQQITPQQKDMLEKTGAVEILIEWQKYIHKYFRLVEPYNEE